MPLLIGGATTSAKHTAVKIAPAYQQATVHVLDASRSVGVVEQAAQSRELAPQFEPKNRAEQSAAGRGLPAAAAGRAGAVRTRPGAQRFATDWSDACGSTSRRSSASRVLDDFPLAELVPYIDWSPFFLSLGAAGQVSRRSSTIPTVGQEATQAVRRRPASCWTRSSPSKLLRARGVYGFWPAASVGDDIVALRRRTARRELTRFHTLRQQWQRKGQNAFYALADFVAPVDSGRQDYLGAFAVTAGLGTDELVAPLRGRPRRLQLDHGQGPGRPAGRGLCRMPAPAGPRRLGLRRRRETVERRPDRRKIPRHPPGPGLSGLPRPHREADLFDLLDAERQRRHHADRELRHVAGGQRSAAGTSPTPRPATSPSTASPATRSRTTPAARG